MYRTILVPLDGSPLGERALPMATVLAQATKARLVLVRSVWAQGAAAQDRHEAQVAEDAQTYLAGVAGRLSDRGVEVETAVPRAAALEGILEEIRSHHADLVVMCTHGRSGLGRYIYGSVTEAILAKSPVPVLLVRALRSVAALSPAAGQTSLLVALDGSAFGEATLPHATDLARALGATLLLLRVPALVNLSYGGPTGMEPGMMELEVQLENEEEAEAQRYLAKLAERIRKDGVNVKTVVHLGWPAEGILEEAKRGGAGLIVMPTHGRTGLRNLVLGSVALEVVHRGLLPLLLVRPSGIAESEPETKATAGV